MAHWWEKDITVKNKGHNDRGIWQGLDFGLKEDKAKTAKRKAEKANEVKIKVGSKGYNKKGTWQGLDWYTEKSDGTTKGKDTRPQYDKKGVQKAADRKVQSNTKNSYVQNLESRGKQEKETARYKKEASSYSRKAKSASMQDSKDVESYRKNRMARGDYKGKYYGPDAFKGDMGKLKAWRKAGSPKDVTKFARTKGD